MCVPIHIYTISLLTIFPYRFLFSEAPYYSKSLEENADLITVDQVSIIYNTHQREKRGFPFLKVISPSGEKFPTKCKHRKFQFKLNGKIPTCRKSNKISREFFLSFFFKMTVKNISSTKIAEKRRNQEYFFTPFLKKNVLIKQICKIVDSVKRKKA